MARSRPEDAVQLAIIALLQAALPPGAVWWATPNGEHRHPVTAARLKRLGVRPGIPDLFVLHAGRLVGIECKAAPKRLPAGKPSQAKPRLSAEQETMFPALAQAGCPTIVAQSVDDVLRHLPGLGLPLRASIGRAAAAPAQDPKWRQSDD